jgi:hypothetical protein
MDPKRLLAKACKQLEHGSPIEDIRITTRVVGQGVYVEVSDFHVTDQLFDVDVWRRFGRAVRNINLRNLIIDKDNF